VHACNPSYLGSHQVARSAWANSSRSHVQLNRAKETGGVKPMLPMRRGLLLKTYISMVLFCTYYYINSNISSTALSSFYISGHRGQTHVFLI
jgi:membrane-bound metal-dependent hydrolase YbcI (DUF457 family)